MTQQCLLVFSKTRSLVTVSGVLVVWIGIGLSDFHNHAAWKWTSVHLSPSPPMKEKKGVTVCYISIVFWLELVMVLSDGVTVTNLNSNNI